MIDSEANSEGKVFAAVDLGSNSFHLIVARYDHGRLQVIDRLKEGVRIAAGLDEDGNLSGEACDRAIECLARFGERLIGVPREHVRAVATNTLRRSRDPQAFLIPAETALGHSIEVISGHEEARLIYVGVAQDLATNKKRRLVIDIGGGSTEFVMGRTGPEHLDTLAVGCVGISQQFFPDDKVTRAALEAAQTAVAVEIRPVRQTYGAPAWEEVVGSSGTIRAVSRILENSGWATRGITSRGLKKLRRALEGSGKVGRLDFPGLSEERRPVFPGGVAVLSACVRSLGIEEMRVSEYSLREGALYDLIGRVRHSDPREASIAALASRYRVDDEQATRVRETALAMFDQVKEEWGLREQDRRLLAWTVQIHEIGLAISHADYHRHGAYLARHSMLDGFSRAEQLILSALILGHRRKPAADSMVDLPPRLVRQVTRSCAILRLSVLLHRSRQRDGIPPMKCSAHGDQLELSFPAEWLAAHPLTSEDLRREQSHLRRFEIELVF
jgi:exopolyphosphatase/guanosine-5'-triphosphate,3'-diphosphate pyrophosphatase